MGCFPFDIEPYHSKSVYNKKNNIQSFLNLSKIIKFPSIKRTLPLINLVLCSTKIDFADNQIFPSLR